MAENKKYRIDGFEQLSMSKNEFLIFFEDHFSFSPINKFKWNRHFVEIYESVLDKLNLVLTNKIIVKHPYNKELLTQIINLINHKKSYSYRRKQADRFILKPEVIKFVFGRDSNKCVRCSSVENLTVDHIVSIYKGGSNDYSNLQTLCKSCNSKKNYN